MDGPLISRVAASCFWMSRYVERAENTARLAGVNRAFVLDVDLPVPEQWWPVVVAIGEQERIREHLPEAALLDGERVLEYLTWNEDNSVSIASSIHSARENARTIREVISLEMWETLNTFQHWLRGGKGRRLFREDPEEFFDRVRDHSSTFQGLAHNTMPHESAFDFMRMGMLIERAGWTARILDVKHHRLDLGAGEVDTPVEAAHAIALLRSCSATDPFFRMRHGAPTGRRVVDFLLRAPNFPRSVTHCLDRAWNFLKRVRPDNGLTGDRSAKLLAALVKDMQALGPDTVFERGLHGELTRIIDTTAAVCDAIHHDYFAPDVAALRAHQTEQ